MSMSDAFLLFLAAKLQIFKVMYYGQVFMSIIKNKTVINSQKIFQFNKKQLIQ